MEVLEILKIAIFTLSLIAGGVMRGFHHDTVEKFYSRRASKMKAQEQSNSVTASAILSATSLRELLKWLDSAAKRRRLRRAAKVITQDDLNEAFFVSLLPIHDVSILLELCKERLALTLQSEGK